MDKHHNKISIRMNGKETLIPREDEKAMEEVVSSKEEQAATAEVYEYERIEEPANVIKPEAWKKHPYYKKKKRKKKVSSPVKNILIVVMTALIFGLLLGFLLLRMFVGMTENDGASANSGVSLTEVNSPGTTDSGSDGNQSMMALPGTDAYVVQAGYFTSREKAEEWSQNYTDYGHPTVVWERDGDVFLFTGLAPDHEAAQSKASRLQQDGLETYVKPWSVPKIEKVNKEKAEPLSGFADLFSATLKGENKGDGWKQFGERLPKEENFMALKDNIAALVSASDSVQQDVLLLEVWKSYEEILKK
ncbi:hypothetical protein GCM10007216_24610 [Thalassobacillus devorans]|uniref:SPOR domain-containing protein n=1 Tax=Thalassobacillus devorans TaxID=279813 RepID=A0ABQ1P7V7_9BACI|nr:hypothetical protein [Thalassobacillus devorans]GGC92931.1 hypothetical protein GCM10007216_24610 [Thalassobacillus devorans]